ncbi:MAG TPA: hypothetical protein VJI96_03235 [Candidatus Andersenbacteria bacterium]|nr:hypothetical protein [Candidatus Andersenbacteria bacterium]
MNNIKEPLNYAQIFSGILCAALLSGLCILVFKWVQGSICGLFGFGCLAQSILTNASITAITFASVLLFTLATVIVQTTKGKHPYFAKALSRSLIVIVLLYGLSFFWNWIIQTSLSLYP